LAWFGALSLSLHAAVFAALDRAAKPDAHPTFDPNSQTLTGDTLDVEPPSPASPEEDSETTTATAIAAATARARANAGPMALPFPASNRPRSSASATAAAASVPEARFGAVGVRFATDLATTFTRAFPQAGSADPTWYSAPFGAAGRAEVTLVLNDEGYIASSEISGSPSPALRRSIDRTLLLLAPRTFTARANVTRLVISAHVSRDDVHDGLHGDVFALSAGSFSGAVGSAFFALPPAGGPGRRVDVEVRLLP
jgi:hypothetical protein